MDIEQELRRIARELLRRPAGRRGGYVITDDELRKFLKNPDQQQDQGSN